MVVEGTVVFATAATTALVGSAVAALAYRGYRRNDSDTMRLLAVGVACFTLFPFVLTYAVGPVLGFSDAATLLSVLMVNVVGLLAVLYSLEAT